MCVCMCVCVCVCVCVCTCIQHLDQKVPDRYAGFSDEEEEEEEEEEETSLSGFIVEDEGKAGNEYGNDTGEGILFVFSFFENSFSVFFLLFFFPSRFRQVMHRHGRGQ
jgi:hypothetical protein